MQLTFLGTGGAQQVPVFGCSCLACQRARQDNRYARGPCSALLQSGKETILIDAGQCHLEQRFTPGELSRIVLTHYHMDHVQGLFPLRWGMGEPIPVFGPPDSQGCDDLFKHPGILDFQVPFTPFEPVQWPGMTVTPVPLQHSKITFGYVFRKHGAPGNTLAWLCDTCGLPPETLAFLQNAPLGHLVLDCSHPPGETPPRNHNDITQALAIHHALQPQHTWLTHISHGLDNWLQENRLPESVSPAWDGMTLSL